MADTKREPSKDSLDTWDYCWRKTVRCTFLGFSGGMVLSTIMSLTLRRFDYTFVVSCGALSGTMCGVFKCKDKYDADVVEKRRREIESARLAQQTLDSN